MEPEQRCGYVGLASWLLSQGRIDEALAWAQRGREHSPLAVSGTNIGWILFHARRYDRLFESYAACSGQPELAVPVLEKAASVSDRSPGVIGVLVRAYAHAGRRSDALRLLAELKRRKQAGYVPAAAFVNAYLGLGDTEQAFAWLERACQEQSNILQYLKVHPFFDPLRDDPRFTDLLHRVGLDQAW